jgi:hypothetical protein
VARPDCLLARDNLLYARLEAALGGSGKAG